MKNNIIINYLSGAWDELKKVSWPSKKEVVNHTIVVIISCAIAIAVVAVIDLGLTYVIQYVVERRG